MPSFPLLPSVQVLFSPFCEKPGLAFRDHHWLAQARKLYLRFPLLPSVQVLFSPSVRNQDWPSGITTGSHKLANYTFVSFATFCSSPLLPFCEKPGLAFRDHHWLAQARKLCLRFPLLPSIQVLFSPSVRNQDWPSGITTGTHKLANYAFFSFATFYSSSLLPFCEKPGLCLRFLCYLLFKSSFLPSVRNQDCLPGSPLGTHKLANYAFVSFASFCSSPLFTFCEKPRPWITRGLLSDSQTCLKCRFVSLANYLRLPLASLLARATHSREDQAS